MSKQKMRGVLAIVLSVVMLLGSISMGVFAAETTEPAYKVAASKTVDWHGRQYAEKDGTDGVRYVYWNTEDMRSIFADAEAVSLKAGEKLYVVLDPVNAEGVLNAAGALGLESYVEIWKEGDETAVAGTWGGASAGAGIAFKFSYSNVADLTGNNAADLLLENLGDATAEAASYPGPFNDANLKGRVPVAEAVAKSGAGFAALGDRGALVTAVTETLYVRPVVEYTAQADGDYTVIFKEAKIFGDAYAPDWATLDESHNNSVAVTDLQKTVTAYVLAPKAAENTSSGSESSASESSNPAPSVSESSNPAPSNPACEHKNATEVKDTAKAPTCTEKGKAADKVCPTCQETIKGAEIAALGHDFGENEPKCSVCGERNPGYKYKPTGPYYEMKLSTAADYHNADCAGDLFGGEYVTLEKGQKMYIVVDPVDAEGNLATGDNGVLECQSLSIQSAAGVEYAAFGKFMDIAGQRENGFTYGYSYTLMENWTKENAANLLLDNFAEMKWKASPKDDGTCQLSGTTDWWAVESTDGLTFPQYLSIIGNHFGSLVSQTNDTMVARAVLVFEAPSDGKFKVVSQYQEWNAAVESQVYVLVETDAPIEDTNNNAGGSSPTTGVDTFVWPVALIALVTMATGVVLCTKKSRAK